MKDQENIIARARRGDADAFEQLVVAYRDQVFRLALRMCGNEAYEIEPSDSIELMRSKYCLLHEIGLCRKTPAYAAFATANDIRDGLFLRNNGRLLYLHFDCKNCEMVIKKA